MKNKKKIEGNCPELLKFLNVANDIAILAKYDEIHIQLTENDGPQIKGKLKSRWDILTEWKL